MFQRMFIYYWFDKA